MILTKSLVLTDISEPGVLKTPPGLVVDEKIRLGQDLLRPFGAVEFDLVRHPGGIVRPYEASV